MRPVQLVIDATTRLEVDVDFEGIPEAVVHDGGVYVLMDAVAPVPAYRRAPSVKTRDKTADELKADLRKKLQTAKTARLEADTHVQQAKEALAELGEVEEEAPKLANATEEAKPQTLPAEAEAPVQPLTSKSGVGFLKVG